VLARWNHQFDKDSSFSLQVYWDHFDRDNTKLANLRWDTYDVDFQHNFKLCERHKIVYGLEYRAVDTFLGTSKDDNGFAESFPNRHRLPQTLSAFVQDEISLIDDKLSLTLGSKFEHNDHTGFEAQPTARLLWTPTKLQSVWASVSRAVRTPSLFEDGINFNIPLAKGFPAFFDLVGNADLKSEELIAYELGYRAQATSKLALDLALFSNMYDKLVAFETEKTIVAPPGSFTPFKPRNQLYGETYGGELALTYQAFKWWQLRGSYSYLKVNMHRNVDAAAQRAILQSQEIGLEGQSPEHQLDMRSEWTLPHHIEFDLISRFVDRLHGFNTNREAQIKAHTPFNLIAKDNVDKYVSLDARIGWKPRKDMELELVGQNLLDGHHPETGGARTETPRGVYAKFTFRF
jgi:iron complex outermembrane receptor protein